MPREEEPKLAFKLRKSHRGRLFEAMDHCFIASEKQGAGEVSDRMKHLDLSLSASKDDFSANIQLANLLLVEGHGKCASVYFKNAMRLRPESAAAVFGFIISLVRYAPDILGAAHRLE